MAEHGIEWRLTKPAFVACDDLRQIQVLARQSDDELRQMVGRHIIDDRRRQELCLINCPRTKQTVRKLRDTKSAVRISRPTIAQSGENHENSLSARLYGVSHRVFARSGKCLLMPQRESDSSRKYHHYSDTLLAGCIGSPLERWITMVAAAVLTVDESASGICGYCLIEIGRWRTRSARNTLSAR